MKFNKIIIFTIIWFSLTYGQFTEVLVNVDYTNVNENQVFIFENFEQEINGFINKLQNEQVDIASRKSSEIVLNFLGPLLPELFGGSADLSGSNNTRWSGSKSINESVDGAIYLYYGVRDFAMSTIIK